MDDNVAIEIVQAPGTPGAAERFVSPAQLADHLDRIELKLDQVGSQNNWIVTNAKVLMEGLMASPIGAMIRKQVKANGPQD